MRNTRFSAPSGKRSKFGAEQQGGAAISPLKATPITVEGGHLAEVVSHKASIDLKPAELGLLLSGEPLTTGGGVREADAWTWDLTRHRPLRPFVTVDARELLVKLDGLSGAQTEQPYVPVSPDALPQALDHLNVAWTVLTGQRLFYPRGLAAPASLVEPASSGDGLTARLGALADVFDLFMRTADGKAPKPGSLTAFCAELTSRLPSAPDQDRALAAVGRLTDINRLRNGRLHTDATNWTESLRRLSVPPGDLPAQQWDRIRSATVEAVYVIIELLQQLIT